MFQGLNTQGIAAALRPHTPFRTTSKVFAKLDIPSRRKLTAEPVLA